MSEVPIAKAVSEAYRRLKSIPGFRARTSQQAMISMVAGALTAHGDRPPIALIEGPTGTGKSLAYLTGAIPAALAASKALVISTATVALQEQLVSHDIPAFVSATGLPVEASLVKGRGRYACPLVLDALTGNASSQGALDLGVDGGSAAAWPFAPTAKETGIARDMSTQIMSGEYSGDLDEWPTTIPERLRPHLSVAAQGCIGGRCPHFLRCPLLNARRQLSKATVLVTNHAMVCADLLRREESSILPPPEDCLYVFDEGHRLAEYAISAMAAELPFASASDFHSEAARVAELITHLLRDFPDAARIAREVAATAASALAPLKHLDHASGQLLSATGQDRHVFSFRGLPPELLPPAKDAGLALGMALTSLRRAHELVSKAIEDKAIVGVPAAKLAGRVGRLCASVNDWCVVCDEYLLTSGDRAPFPPAARWMIRDGDSHVLHTSPVSVAGVLHDKLWSRLAGAIVTSATLTSLGTFRHVIQELGAPSGVFTLQAPSPFDLPKQAKLLVPDGLPDPRSIDAHTEAVTAFLERELRPEEAGLVLFASRQQMRSVANTLSTELRRRVLTQDDMPRAYLLDAHVNAVAAGVGSVLFGLASFAEGLDLPGALCRHVVIAKVPFDPPNDPIGMTLSEWLLAAKRSPFAELVLPRASRRLTQWCGRLIRSESDTGRISILDARLLHASYGRKLLGALPPFHKDLGFQKPVYAEYEEAGADAARA